MLNNNLHQGIPQDENRGCEAEDTVVQTVPQEGGSAALGQPHEGVIPDAVPGDLGESAPVISKTSDDTPTALPATTQNHDSPDADFVGEIPVDPGTFKVIQGRKNSAPNAQKVKEIQEAIKQNRVLPSPDVYEDIDTGERFSPDGGHRQAAHAGLGRPIRIRLFKIKHAKERAEAESCKANSGNGLSASPADRRYQLKKACELFHADRRRYPKPSELAVLTAESHQKCTDFLRDFLAPKVEELSGRMDEVEQKLVVEKVDKARGILVGIKLDGDWLAGDLVKDALEKVGAEMRRIGVYKPREPEVTPKELEDFRQTHNLTIERLAKLLGVKHPTVSRWLRDKTKMTEHNKRVARQLLRLTQQQIADMLEGDGGNVT